MELPGPIWGVGGEVEKLFTMDDAPAGRIYQFPDSPQVPAKW